MPRVRADRYARTWILCFCLILLASTSVRAATQLQLAIGFDEQFLRKRFTPVRVEVSGLSEPIQGRLVLSQDTGSDILHPRTISYELVAGRVEDGTYEATVPIYDPFFPVEAKLVDALGVTVARESKNVRLSAREEAFPVVVGALLRFHATESLIEPADLPREWWAYDGVKALWIASPSIARAQWEAIAEWLTSGGSAVIFSGSDFYQLDSPLVRALLPLTSPTLVDGDDERQSLTGTLRPGAQVVLERGGLPLLIHRAYGAGHVYLVTCRAADLREGDLTRLETSVRSATTIPSMDRFLKESVAATDVLRPLYVSAPLIGVLCTSALVMFYRVARRRYIGGVVLLVTSLGAITVLSALYTNWAGHLGFVHHISTRFSIQTDVGIEVVSDGLYSIRPLTFSLSQPRGSYPLQTDFRPQSGMDLDTTGTPEKTVFVIPTGKLFLFRTGSKAKSALAFEVRGDTIAVTNGPESESCAALVVLDGRYYSLGWLTPGANTFRRATLEPVSASSVEAAERSLYRCVSDWLPTQGTDWLVARFESEREITSGPFKGKERVIDIVVVAGGSS